MQDRSKSLYADLNAFTTVVRRRSFSAAAVEMGVTPSAVSHSIRRLEERLRATLLQRTSRAVVPTAEGLELASKLATGFQTIEAALDDLHGLHDHPAGVLRLNVPHDASRLLIAPALPAFTSQCPAVRLLLVVEDHPIDLVGEGFDAGIRYGDKVPESMVAVPLTPQLRWVVVGSPAYLRQHGRPQQPRDLRKHACIGILLGDRSTYAWELGEGKSAMRLSPASICSSSDTQTSIDAVMGGLGLAYILEARIAADVEAGRLEVVLPEWSSSGPAMYMYYPSRKRKPPALSQLVNIIRQQQGLTPIPGATRAHSD